MVLIRRKETTRRSCNSNDNGLASTLEVWLAVSASARKYHPLDGFRMPAFADSLRMPTVRRPLHAFWPQSRYRSAKSEWTQEHSAERAGVSLKYWQRWKADRKPPRFQPSAGCASSSRLSGANYAAIARHALRKIPKDPLNRLHICTDSQTRAWRARLLPAWGGWRDGCAQRFVQAAGVPDGGRWSGRGWLGAWPCERCDAGGLVRAKAVGQCSRGAAPAGWAVGWLCILHQCPD